MAMMVEKPLNLLGDSKWTKGHVKDLKIQFEQLRPLNLPDATATAKVDISNQGNLQKSDQISTKKKPVLNPCSAEDFQIGRIVGAGSYGRVSIATHIKTRRVCAIKTLAKAAILKEGQLKHLRQEKDLLGLIDHPFIVPLLGHFQDKKHVHIVMDFMQGGEFFTLMREQRRLSEDYARFYAANILLALEALHARNIAYRDLKPENCLLGSDGYLRLGDMGFGKVVENATYTMCGTPDYMAPEVVECKGHNKCADWWSFGCVIHEMLVGFPPFYADSVQERYRRILIGKMHPPEHASSLLKDLLTKLIKIKPQERLGANGSSEVREHPWFAGIDWAVLAARRYRPPFMPPKMDADPAARFDDYSNLAPLRQGSSLTAEQQALFRGF